MSPSLAKPAAPTSGQFRSRRSSVPRREEPCGEVPDLPGLRRAHIRAYSAAESRCLSTATPRRLRRGPDQARAPGDRQRSRFVIVDDVGTWLEGIAFLNLTANFAVRRSPPMNPSVCEDREASGCSRSGLPTKRGDPHCGQCPSTQSAAVPGRLSGVHQRLHVTDVTVPLPGYRSPGRTGPLACLAPARPVYSAAMRARGPCGDRCSAPGAVRSVQS
jgi:hypothetical protein